MLTEKKLDCEYGDQSTNNNINNISALMLIETRKISNEDLACSKFAINSPPNFKPSISSSLSMFNLIHNENNNLISCDATDSDAKASISKRAQWDKSMQKINYKSQYLNYNQVNLKLTFLPSLIQDNNK